MPDITPILSMPLILPAQAQKHVTHNESLALLDVIVQLAVINRTLTSAPALPAIGNRHIVAEAATGLWAGQSGNIATFTETGWQFITPLPGWQAFVLADMAPVAFDGAVWVEPAGGGGGDPETLPLLGINATADTTNRLTVAAPSVLLNHAGAGHQVKVNKALAADTASLLFQTGFSGRAEMGTLGSDAFGIKVSATGSGFVTAMSVVAASGIVSLPAGVAAAGFALRDGTDTTKRAEFAASGISTGTTRTYTLPDVSSEVAVLGGTQSFTGTKTFSGGFTVSGLTASFGSATGNATYGLGAGATLSGSSKSVSIGTGGVAGSTTAVVIGSAVAGSLGTTVIHSPTVTLGAAVTSFDMGAASARAGLMGVGGATADATNRLAVTAPAVLFNHAGAGVEAVLNKAASGDTAALAFKTGFSTRGRIGLVGDDALALQVSPDGAVFSAALTADPATAQVTLAKPVVLAGQAADPGAPVAGTVWHNATTGQIRAQAGSGLVVLDGQQSLPMLVPVAGDLVLTSSAAGGAATTTVAGAANRVDLFAYVPRADLAVDRLVLNCTTAVAAAQAKIVIYGSDANGRPAALITETAVLDLATTGNKLATVAVTLRQGRTYWVGVRSSSTATVSAWALTATPDINGGATAVTTARKVLRRTLTFATAAPATWGFVSAEINAGPAPALWLRVQ